MSATIKLILFHLALWLITILLVANLDSCVAKTGTYVRRDSINVITELIKQKYGEQNNKVY